MSIQDIHEGYNRSLADNEFKHLRSFKNKEIADGVKLQVLVSRMMKTRSHTEYRKYAMEFDECADAINAVHPHSIKRHGEWNFNDPSSRMIFAEGILKNAS